MRMEHHRGNRAGGWFSAPIGRTSRHRCRAQNVCLSLDRRADRQSALLPEGRTGLIPRHRKLSKAHKGTHQREKRRQVVARVHERVRWRRENFIRQQVASLIKRFGFIAVEALVVRNMLKNPKVSQEHRRCGLVVILRTTPQQSGRGWPRSGASEPGLYVANLFGLRTSPGERWKITAMISSHRPNVQTWPKYSPGPTIALHSCKQRSNYD